jgi:hypothetical protein
MCAALWSALSVYIAPIFWRTTSMPFFCDMLGVISLTLALWWIRKFGSVTVTGVTATIIIIVLNPNATHFFGFTTTSVIFDVLTRLIGYQNCLEKPIISVISLLFASVVSAAVAGVVIRTFFMNPNFLMIMLGGVVFFSMLHAARGVIGGTIGLMLTKALSRGLVCQRYEK